MKTYLFVYAGSSLLALVITPIVIWLARRFDVADTPGARHVHTKPTTHIGGMAIFLSTMCLAGGALFLSDVIGIPNLGTRGTAYLKYLLERYLLWLDDAATPVEIAERARELIHSLETGGS